MKMKVSIFCLVSLQCLLPQTDLNAGPSDTVLFNQGGGSCTASADVSFASLLFSQWSTFARGVQEPPRLRPA